MLFIMASHRSKYKVQRRPVKSTSLILFVISDDLFPTTEAEGCREQVLIGFLPCYLGERFTLSALRHLMLEKVPKCHVHWKESC